jgi:hypothetical protein
VAERRRIRVAFPISARTDDLIMEDVIEGQPPSRPRYELPYCRQLVGGFSSIDRVASSNDAVTRAVNQKRQISVTRRLPQ